MQQGIPPSEDSTLFVGEPEILPVVMDEQGTAHEAHFIFQQLLLMPVGPGQIGGIPYKLLRMPINKKSLGEFIKKAELVHSQLSEPSDLAIATSMADANNFAARQKGIIGA